MRATLTLDDDVTALLERARRKNGQSLQELANRLLRATLKRLGSMAARPSTAARDEVRQPFETGPYRIRPFPTTILIYEHIARPLYL